MDHTKPSTWLASFKWPIQELPFSPKAALQVSEEAYTTVARVRPIILAMLQKDVTGGLMAGAHSDEVSIEDLLLPVIHNLSSARVVEKLTEFHGLRHMMCRTASELAKPPLMYRESNGPVFYMRAPSVEEFESSQVGDVVLVIRRIMTELKITLACIGEAEAWIAEHDGDADMRKIRHLRNYIWRSASLAVVVAQCLQMVTAYYTFLSCERNGGSKFVGVAATGAEVSADAEVIFAPRIHA